MPSISRTLRSGGACGVTAVALSLAAAIAPSRAELVFHFDPNDVRTTFQGGWEDNRDGTVPAVNVGDPVGWLMDTRVPSSPTPDPDNGQDGWIDAQQGNGDNKPVLARHPAGNVLNFRDTGNNDNLLVFDQDLALTDGVNGLANNNVATLLLAARVDPAGTGNSYLIDFRDDAPIGGGADAVNGFSLRYNHTEGLLEGMIKQAVAVSLPVEAGSWFAARLVWNGPSTTASLTVETLAGVQSTGGAAEATALLSDRLRLGNNSASNSGMLGQLGDVLFYNDVADRTSEFNALADAYVVPLPELTIDRTTGKISIVVPTGAQPITNIAGYTMTSAAGALDPTHWKSIADNYDASNPGPNQVDPDNQWTKLSNPSLRTDLSELEFQGNGGANNGADFLAGKSTDLGDVWIPSPIEDVQISLIRDDGSVEPLEVRFVGNGGGAFAFGDLDFDGDVDQDDFFDVFVPNFDADTSSVNSTAVRYGLGDLDDNGVVALEDFLLFNAAYLAANPGAAALSLSPVPEPAALGLAGLATAAALVATRRRQAVGRAVCACCLLGLAAQPARADLLAHWRFDEAAGATTLVDSKNGYNGVAGNGVTGGASGQIGGAWAFDQPSQQYVDLTAHLSQFRGLTQGTISTWFKRPSVGGAAVILSAYDSTVGSTEGRLFFENADLRWDVRDEALVLAEEAGQINAGNFSNDQWNHVAAVFDSSLGVTLYVNGNVAGTGLEPFFGQIGALDGLSIGRNIDSSAAGGQWFYNGLLDDMQIYDEPLPAPALQAIYQAGLQGESLQITDTELKLQINTTTGDVSLVNATVLDFDVDAYRLTSVAGSLQPATWNSLEDQDFEGQGARSGWTELGKTTNQLSEGFLGGSSIVGAGSAIGLGAAYGVSIDARDVVAELHLKGAPATSFVEALVEYVSGFTADFDGDGDVDGNDLAQWQGDFGVNGDSDANGDGRSGGADLLAWQRQFGRAAAAPATSAVPESASALLAAIAATCAAGLRRRRAAGAALALCVLASSADACRADAFVERSYRLGDDAAEGAAVGAGSIFTFDSSGVNAAAFPGAINTGAFQDLSAFGNPLYANVGSNGLKRPGLGATGVGGNPPLGIVFDGQNDRLQTDVSLNSPNQTWNSTLIMPGTDAQFDPPSASGVDGTGDGLYRPAFPHNYARIFGRAIQLWVRPTLTGARQDIVLDTEEHGVYITPSNTWGLHFDNGGVDSGVAVSSSLDANGWAHVMVVSGYVDPTRGGSAFGGALLVNGTAVAVRNEFYDNALDGLSVGGNLAGDANWFSGTLDDLQLLVWGDNSFLGPQPTQQEPGYLGGADWGRLEAGDNQWIALQLAARAQSAGVSQIPSADVNFDGIVAGDGSGSAATDDVAALIGFWQSQNLVGGSAVGDWNSRQQGDLNNDGATNMFDAILLRDALRASGGGSFDLSLLAGAAVPEPTSSALLVAAGGCLAARRRRR